MKKAIIGIVIAAGVTGLYLILRIIGDYKSVPSASNWRQASQIIYQEMKPGDVIAFSPFWLIGYATDNNQFQYASFYEIKDILKNRSLRSPGLWVVMRGFDGELRKKLEKVGYEQVNINRVGQVYYDYYYDKQEELLFDFSNKLKEASAWLENSSGVQDRGVYENNAFIFTKITHDWSWINIRNVVYSFGQKRKNVIWFHPVEGEVKKLQYHNVNLGTHLRLWLGLADSGRAYDTLRSCTFSIDVNGAPIRRLKIDEGNADQYWEFDTKAFAPNSEVTFSISCAGNVTERHIFFKAASYQKRTNP